MNVTSVSHLQASMLDKMEMQSKIASNPFSQPQHVSTIGTIESSNLKVGSSIKSVLDIVNSHAQDANAKVRAVELGLSDDLIGATVATQKASLSFSALMQVRNKMVSNFDDIIRMAI